MQFMITAYDGDDDEAVNRRMAAREDHLAGIRVLIEGGNFVAGGAILNDAEQMIGSTLYVEFTNKDTMNDWLFNDPYVTGGVWKDISVQPIRLALRDN